MAVGTDSTGKHVRRLPAPRLKGQSVAPAGKAGIALFRGRYVKIGQVAPDVAERLGADVCCVTIDGKHVIGRIEQGGEVLNPRNNQSEHWVGAKFVPL